MKTTLALVGMFVGLWTWWLLDGSLPVGPIDVILRCVYTVTMLALIAVHLLLQRRRKDACGELLRRELADNGAAFTVSKVRPLVDSEHGFALVCPHGITYFTEPTGEQIMRWNNAAE